MMSIPPSNPSEKIPPGYCQCGCGQRTKIAKRTDTALGWIKGQPIRYILGHVQRGRYKPINERFWSKVEKTGPANCWIWRGAKHPSGHGRFYCPAYGESYAHRVAYILAHGPIPVEAWILHRCNNPACVNPHHLYLGTPTDNAADRIAAGTNSAPPIRHGIQHPSSKLNEKQVLEIRQLYQAGGVTQRRLAALFDVSQPAIRNIINRKVWREVP